MRTEKKYINEEYVSRLNQSPYFMVVDYKGLTVSQFSELRHQLSSCDGEIHVVKNSIFRRAVKETTEMEWPTGIAGQLAMVTGERDFSVVAKVIKDFHKKSKKPVFRFGCMENSLLDAEELDKIAGLPSLEVLRGQLLGVLQAPAGNLVRLINEPGTRLARVLKAKFDSEEN